MFDRILSVAPEALGKAVGILFWIVLIYWLISKIGKKKT
jgi:hypothetical protein